VISKEERLALDDARRERQRDVVHRLSDRERVLWAIADGEFDNTAQVLVPKPVMANDSEAVPT
jgi:hypothetical protein